MRVDKDKGSFGNTAVSSMHDKRVLLFANGFANCIAKHATIISALNKGALMNAIKIFK
jgi:hypothetical protein